MATTITVLSQKGGTGKTTTTRTLVDIFRRIGLRVLAVDMDPQGNLTDYFDVGDDPQPTLADVLAERAETDAAIHSDVLPASIHLAEAELLLSGKIGREMVLRRSLGKVARRLRPDPDRLPAVARSADRQRARRGRLRADLHRGRVLLAPGRRAGARGGRGRRAASAPT